MGCGRIVDILSYFVHNCNPIFLTESVLSRILFCFTSCNISVGAHSVRPRADNVRPYMKSAKGTLPFDEQRLCYHS